MKKVVNGWIIEGDCTTTVAHEYDDGTIDVALEGSYLRMKNVNEFPADFIRPVLNDPDMCNVLMYPSFEYPDFSEDCDKILDIINLVYHREHPYKLGYYYDIEREVHAWKELEH